MFEAPNFLTAAPHLEPRTVGGRLVGYYRAGSTCAHPFFLPRISGSRS